MRYLKFCLLFLLIAVSSTGYSQPSKLSRSQFLEDLAQLEAQLKRHHPNLYTYQTPAVVDKYLVGLQENTKEETSNQEAYAKVASFCSMIQDGHLLALPRAEKLEEYEQANTLFPFDVISRGKRLYLVRDYQLTEGLEAGTEILQINGVPAEELLGFLRRRLPMDGPEGVYADWILSTYFRAYYFFFFPPAETFSLELIRPGSGMEQLQAKGASLSQIERVRKERFPAYAAALTDRMLNPIKFDVLPEKGLAVLSIRDFHRSVHRKAGQKFTKIIDEAMADLARKKVEYLIIDIRDNQGGDINFSHYLLKYLLEEPFQTVDHFARVKHTEGTADKLRLRSIDNRFSREIKPRENHYQGKVYLLTNGGSFSNSGIFAWMIRKHQRGLILGSTTGGSSWSLCGGPNKMIRLSNSGIQVEIPTTRYALHPAGDIRGGVIPDKSIQPTALDIASGNDVVLNAVITQIESSQKTN